jgi:hypothetical protein
LAESFAQRARGDLGALQAAVVIRVMGLSELLEWFKGNAIAWIRADVPAGAEQ